MPRENSFSDEGRSLTPDLDEAEGLCVNPQLVPAPTTTGLPAHAVVSLDRTLTKNSLRSRFSRAHTSIPLQDGPSPIEKFRAAVRRVIAMRRGISTLTAGFVAQHGIVGDEPGVDPQGPLADATHGHLQVPCHIEIVDYSSVRCQSQKMNNREFVDFMNDESVKRDPWVKVRWINIGGLSWDVLKAVGIRYSESDESCMINRSSTLFQIYILWHWKMF